MSPPPPLPSRLCRFSDAPLPHHHAVHWRPRGCIQGGIGVHAVVAVKLRKVVEPNYGSTGETQRYQFYDSNNYNKKLMKLLVRQGGGASAQVSLYVAPPVLNREVASVRQSPAGCSGPRPDRHVLYVGLVSVPAAASALCAAGAGLPHLSPAPRLPPPYGWYARGVLDVGLRSCARRVGLRKEWTDLAGQIHIHPRLS